jgi:hypothetical protein
MGHEEDRDQKFEQALARHLRAEAGAGAAADGLADGCPDAEVLAAFHERMLSSEEMSVVKEHVAACSRCQEILVHLEGTEKIEVQAEEERENVTEMRESVLSTGALYVDYAARQNSGFPMVGSPASPVTTERAPRDISTARSWKFLRWVAPAGAIAAGFLIWAVVRDKPHEFAPVQNVQVAQQRAGNEQAAIPQAQVPQSNLRSDGGTELSRTENKKSQPAQGFGTRSRPAEAQAQLTDRLSDGGRSARGAVGGMVAGQLQAEDQEQGHTDKYLPLAKPAAPPPSTDKRAKNLPAMGRNGVLLSPKADGAKAPARERDTLNKEKLEPRVAGGASPVPSAPPAPGAMSETVVVQDGVAAAPESAAKKDADAKANSQVAITAQAEVSASYARTSAALKSKVADDAKVIATPGGRALWRLRDAGLIERSEDRGLTWTRQVSGTTRDLIAGSAPSDVVCWIVGRRGVILRTVDGGGHWEKVGAPVAADLAGIRATDALHAAVLDRAGRAKFATSDGGVKWERVQE